MDELELAQGFSLAELRQAGISKLITSSSRARALVYCKRVELVQALLARAQLVYMPRATCLRLILRWSMTLLMFPYYPFLPVPSQRTWSPRQWSNSKNTFMPIHRAMSEPMPLSRSMPFLPRTNRLQRLCCTIYDPQLVGVSLFWRWPSFYMPYVWGCPFACVSTSSIWC